MAASRVNRTRVAAPGQHYHDLLLQTRRTQFAQPTHRRSNPVVLDLVIAGPSRMGRAAPPSGSPPLPAAHRSRRGQHHPRSVPTHHFSCWSCRTKIETTTTCGAEVITASSPSPCFAKGGYVNIQARLRCRTDGLDSLADDKKEHLSLLRSMHSVGLKWSHKSLEEDASLTFGLGYHSFPSIRQLHLHELGFQLTQLEKQEALEFLHHRTFPQFC